MDRAAYQVVIQIFSRRYRALIHPPPRERLGEGTELADAPQLPTEISGEGVSPKGRG